MKKFFSLILIFCFITFCFTGCFKTEVIDDKIINNEIEDVSDWKNVLGSYNREDNSQFNNALLNLKYLSGNAAIFEFKLMEGSESEEEAIDTVISGVMSLNGNKGVYETNEKSITFEINDEKISVTHQGDFAISPDGVYEFVNDGIELSDELVAPILMYLPQAQTGLDSKKDYTINVEGLVNDWFYPANAVLNENGNEVAKFVIAKDVSAIYRVDDEATLIFGSAKNMMDAETYIIDDFEDVLVDDEEEEAIFEFDEQIPIVNVISEKGTLLEVGEESNVTAELPWKLGYTIEMTSEDDSIVSVKGDVLTAVSEGDVTISGKIFIDDAEKDFSINITVVNSIDEIFE